MGHIANMNMKPLGSDNTSFKLWSENVANAFEAAVKSSRALLELMTAEIAQGAMKKMKME